MGVVTVGGMKVLSISRIVGRVHTWCRVTNDAALIAVLALAVGCAEQDRLPVRFIVPDGYHGPLTVIVKADG